ncbi:hypothetical protein [Peribacillus acanthi]|uniref:hypothetical protein n=1 Tax=Peribacillus acanthi TaxID=2171554 RepID=UPI000D3E9134|nr:hypothetical protein [Peribacillus acanthi]
MKSFNDSENEIGLDEEFDLKVDLDDSKESKEDELLKQVKEDEEETELDLSAFIPSVSSQSNRVIGEAGIMSVIYSKNGMRVVPSKDLMEQLGNPKTVQVGLSDYHIAMAEYLGDDFTSYPCWSKSGAKSVIYRSELVRQIKDHFELDFQDRTSITFAKAIYKTNNGKPIALIEVIDAQS